MTGYSRRSFLQIGGIAAAGGLIPACAPYRDATDPAPTTGEGNDAFVLLRRRWREVTAGSGFDATAEPYRTRLAKLGTTAARYRDTMAPADTSLWPESAFPSFVDTPARLRTMARATDHGWARVLANSARQQGVRVRSLGITAVNFWNGGTVADLTADAPCAVLVRESGDGTATLTVSDPRRDLDELTVTWDRPVAEVLDGHPLLTGATTGARLTLAFGRLAGRGGGSQTVTVRLDRHADRERSPG